MEPHTYYEYQIHLREYLIRVLRHKWVILGALVLPVLTVWLVSMFILPPRYQSSVLVAVERPDRVTVSLNRLGEQIHFPPRLPDIKIIASLAETDSILVDVKQAAADPDEVRLSVSHFGDNRVQLEVTAHDPQTAALLADLWANRYVDFLNGEYSLDLSISQLQGDIAAAQQVFTEAGDAIVDTIIDSQLPVLKAQLQAANEELVQSLSRGQDISEDERTAQTHIEELESQILRLSGQIAAIENELQGYAHQRDGALEDYWKLQTQYDKIKQLFSEGGQIAEVVADADVSDTSDSNKLLIDMVIAGVIGLFSSISIVLVYEWLRNPLVEHENEKK